MSEATEILNGLTDDEITAYSADMSTEPHIIIDKNRYISVPDELRKIAVQYDHNIETVTFDCIRYWDGHDLSAMNIYINYTRADGVDGTFKAENVTVDETDDSIIHFTWTISGNVTFAKGILIIHVCAEKVDANGNVERRWNTELNSEMTVSPGKRNGAILDDIQPDLLAQLNKNTVFYFKNDGEDLYVYTDYNCETKASKKTLTDALSAGSICIQLTDSGLIFIPAVVDRSENYAMVGITMFGDASAIMTTLYTKEWL